jgi:hypothetical protein
MLQILPMRTRAARPRGLQKAGYGRPHFYSRDAMKKMNKEDAVTAAAIVMLIFTAMIDWNLYSLLIYAAIVLILGAWYYRSKQR